MSFGSHHNEEARRFGKVNVLTGNANSKTSGNITSPSTIFRSHQYEEAKRPEISPRVPDKSSPPAHQANLSPQDRFKMVDYSDIYDSREDASTKYSYSRAPKRNRSPQQLSTAVLGMSPVQLDPDREMLAKARRLARFSVELSQPTETLQSAKHHARESKHNRASLDKMETDKLTESRSLSIKDNFSEMGSLEFSSAVVGLCQDMCPESEREERERKGDLDKYERLDGERNQTSEYLAVKKYNRTAEREADLIRPMPVLQKTMDYLLNLLNQPYNEDFLNIYNFLWDRMRAIRMDLRMQHYFNHQAITMLEQMIRLHIVAMHELCEYNKGEGFSEGFDAHLNIEQMNKASVELFQMYDDHRKKGIYVPTEKEFRGYYALLKLDKHPGYKVEPAELSLDLAKMTPAIRCTPQILFARDVARACRIGNYIAFFRLARKATYLQACLMHAHFAKLRRHALASLYSSLPSSLQNNRGIPVTDVIDWLGLEDEDVESLLEYHGFVLKKFEEAFMVKEGPFLNSDTDFPTKRSQLVHLKRSQVIIHDIYSDPTSSRYSEKIDMKSQKSILNIKSGPIISVFPEKQETRPNEFEMFEADASETDTLQVASNDVIHDLEADTVVGTIIQPQNFFDMQTPFLISEIEVQAPEVFKPHDTSVANDHVQQNEDEQVVESERETYMDRGLSPKKPCADIVGYVAPVSSPMNASINNSSPQVEINREHENKEHLHLHVLYQKKQVADEKLIMFFRKWKRVAKRSRESREQRIMLANAAFNSLSVGAPVVRPYKALSRAAINELNISDTATKRYEKQSKSWSTINVAELVAPVLSSWNPDAKCLCWKLLVLVQPSVNEGVTNYVSSRWLLSKLMCSSKENDTPIVSVPHLSIWRSWINTQLGSFYNCCLAIIREATFVNNDISDDDAVTGASSVIFHVSENIPWEIQKMRLHNVLSRIPTGSNIPLLIVSGDAYTEETIDPSSTIIRRLGLHDIELTTISSFLVVFLYDSDTEENHSGFFKDDQLRMGLLWLANYSPLQPSISLMKTREVVSFYLISATEILEYADTSNFGPNQCISIFNAALDRLVQEIYGAASLNVNHWPSPEVDLLEKSSYEHAFVDMYLPSVGWSLPSKIQPLLEAIKGCKLPEFSNDISWLKKGSYMGLKIPDQKIALEECLINYMTESCQMLGSDLAAREARIMVQTGADLELCGSYYYIVPRWLVIFRRIQNWRLKNLTTGLGTVAYLLEQHQDSLPEIDNVQRISAYTPYLEKANSEKLGLMHSFTTKLSFDEIAEVLNYEVPLTEQSITLQEPSSSIPVVDGGGEAPKTDNLVKNNDAEPKYSSSRTGELQLAITLPKMDDRLAMLLEKVTKHQDRIDKQLSLYF